MNMKLAILLGVAIGLSACGTNKTQVTKPITMEVEAQKKPVVKKVLTQSMYFKFDSSKKFYSGKPLDDTKYLKASKVILEGNCDVRGSDKYNDKLGKKRAMTVANIMMAEGALKENVQVITYGKKKPICSENTKKCHQLNRRVDIFMIK